MAQKKIPSKLFEKFLAKPTSMPRSSISQLSESQLLQMIRRVEQQQAAATRENLQQKKLQEQIFTATRPAVFRVLPPSKADVNAITGTIFKTEYNGETEIFGIVPMHALRAKEREPGTLAYKFQAVVNTPNGIKVLPAWVVQLSSSFTGDVALVKFRKTDEALLSPLSLSSAPVQFPSQAYSQGFARNILAQQTFPLVDSTSSGILLARLPAAYPETRAGFCGSPIMNAEQKLTGIHIGSSYLQHDPKDREILPVLKLNSIKIEGGDIGYVAPASFLQHLVDAYHTPSLKPVSIAIAGQNITQLAINEYISRIELLDKDQNVLIADEMRRKVSFSTVETAIRLRPDVTAIRLQIGRSHWEKDEKGWYVVNQPNIREIVHPLQGR